MFNATKKIDIKIDAKKEDSNAKKEDSNAKKEDSNAKKEDKIKPIFVCNAKCNECLIKKCYLF